MTLTPPNSLAVVCPASTAPPAPVIRSSCVEVTSLTPSRSGTDACVYGQPVTWSSSFTPIGTPPNGLLTSAARAAASASSRGVKQNALRSLASIADYTAASSSAGERRPLRYSSTSEHASPCHGVMSCSLSPGR